MSCNFQKENFVCEQKENADQETGRRRKATGLDLDLEEDGFCALKLAPAGHSPEFWAAQVASPQRLILRRSTLQDDAHLGPFNK